jgi:cell wall-associated NlpC family hydrolase
MLPLHPYILTTILAITTVPEMQWSCTLSKVEIAKMGMVAPLNKKDYAGPAEELVSLAQTFKGTPYKYASANPANGFDCSGFVMYVFNHFQISVPRSSYEFTKFGKEVDLKSALPGDVILFTGSNAQVRRVGHVGIITQAGDDLQFIHASSGKAYSIIETSFTPHYQKRFMKIVRVLE